MKTCGSLYHLLFEVELYLTLLPKFPIAKAAE